VIIGQPFAQQEGYDLLNGDLRIHSMNGRARQWMGEPRSESTSVDEACDGSLDLPLSS
jgi:hypothetical protein